MAYEHRTRHRVGVGDLEWLIDVVLPGAGRAGGSVTSVAGEPYRVLPSAALPWVLAPGLGRPALARAMASRWGLASRRIRVVRGLAAAAALARSGPPATPRGVPAVAVADLRARISEALGQPLWPVVVIGESDPNRKPTLQLVDQRGATKAYAKVGWNPATRALVRNDARALRLAADRLDGAVSVVRPLVVADYDDLGVSVLVTEPMPPTARLWPAGRPPDDHLLTAVAAALAMDGRLRPQPVAELALWAEQGRRLAAVEHLEPTGVATVLAATTAIRAEAPRDSPVLVGGWHGDLVSWNVATVRDERRVWDLEYAGNGRPLGLDLLHWTFAFERHVRRSSVPDAVEEVLRMAGLRLPRLGVHPAAVRAVVLAYLVERWLRAAELVSVGAPWDRGVHPELLTAVARLGAGR